MLIHKTIGLNPEEKDVISFIGGGGKSTSMNMIAKELRNMGKKVLVTTTTVLFEPEHKDNDKFILGVLPEEYKPRQGTITLFGKTMDDGKIRGVDPEELEEIYNRNIFDIILIEADGAKRKPIKAPADHEPVVPGFSTMTIGVIGLDSVGRPLDEENTHRPELLRAIFNIDLPHIIEAEDIVKLAIDKDGLFKGTYGEKIIFLNKAYKDELVLLGEGIRQSLQREGFKNIYITDIRKSKIY